MLLCANAVANAAAVIVGTTVVGSAAVAVVVVKGVCAIICAIATILAWSSPDSGLG